MTGIRLAMLCGMCLGSHLKILKKQKNKQTKIKDLLPTVPTANILLSDKAISRKMHKIPSEI